MRERLESRDPEFDALRRAARAGLILPVPAALGYFAGGGDVSVFAIFGAIALLIVADFPGNRAGRAVSYAALAVIGTILITLGTLVSPNPWLAVGIMFVLGLVVTLAGVLSTAIAAGQRATLLTFVLPACTPAGPIPDRLLGWGIAVAVCLPAALFVFPPRHHDELRRLAAAVCATLARRLEGRASGKEVNTAMNALYAHYLGSDYRPVGLTAGSRALVRVVDELGWLSDRVSEDTAATLGLMADPSARVLRCSARLLRISRVADRTATRAELDAALDELRSVAQGRYRDDIARLLREPDDADAVAVGARLLDRRAFGATVAITGRVVAAAAAADARPVWMRVLGRQVPEPRAAVRVMSERRAVATIPSGYLATGAVVVRNSLRTGLGLAVAVATTHLFPVEHGFWVVLAAMSVLRSSALTTGTKVLRAVVGTVAGFVIGAGLIELIGTDPMVMWITLPIVAFIAAYVPEIASFAAGQAAFTMLVLIVFNLNDPSGWQVGLIRVEDILVGGAVGIVVSLLLWPRGSGPALTTAIESAYEIGTRYLCTAVARVTRDAPAVDVAELGEEMMTASRTVDNGVRHYLSENSNSPESRAPVIERANGAVRLRAAADLISDIPTLPSAGSYPQARTVLEDSAGAICDRMTGAGSESRMPATIAEPFVTALRADVGQAAHPIADALPLLTVAANLDELKLLQQRD